MDENEPIRRLHEHRAWVNRLLLDAAAHLSRKQLEQPHSIGQGSIWKSLLHLYAAEFVWLEALNGNTRPIVPGDLPEKLPGNQEGDGGITTLTELREKWAELEARWRNYLAGLNAAALDEFVNKVSTGSGKGKTHRTRRADVLMHVCTHAHYTAAQVVNMLRHVGAKQLPDVMLISLARQQMPHD